MGTRIEQLEKQVEVLREALGLLKVYSGDRTTRNAASVAIIAADFIAAAPVEETVTAPTWRPIAEMPPEWRDGRWVVLSIGWSPSICMFSDGAWRFLDGRYIEPTHYLDLAIPEVPRG